MFRRFGCTSLLSIVLAQPTFIYAEQEVGNGGDIVYCDRNGDPTYEVLDHWEARAYFGFTSILDELSGDYKERVSYVIERFKTDFPSTGEYLSNQLENFEDQVRFVDNMDIVLIPDAHPRVLPSGCSLRQIANQKEPVFPGEKLFVIDSHLWNKLDAANQASLVLHELIYRYALRVVRHTNSLHARYVVAYISQRDYSTQPEHLRISAARHVFGSTPKDDVSEVACFSKGYFMFNGLGISCKGGAGVFYPNGNVKTGSILINNELNPIIGNMTQKNLTPNEKKFIATFTPDGHLDYISKRSKPLSLKAKVAYGRILNLNDSAIIAEPAPEIRVFFHHNQTRSIRKCRLSKVRVNTRDGAEHEIYFDEVTFDEDGFAVFD